MIWKTHLRNVVSSLLAILLLAIYLSADLAGSLHSCFVHEKQTGTVCSPVNEKDPCHKTIFHHDTENGCHHTNHITKPMVKCEICSMLLTRHVLPFNKASRAIFEAQVLIPDLKDQLVTSATCTSHGLRGPPSFA